MRQVIIVAIVQPPPIVQQQPSLQQQLSLIILPTSVEPTPPRDQPPLPHPNQE